MTDQVHDRADTPDGDGADAVTTDTRISPDDTTAEPKRRFKFPTAFTVLFFVLVLVWVLTFFIKPGAYSYVSCDGGSPKPIPGTFSTVKLDLSFQRSGTVTRFCSRPRRASSPSAG